MRIIKDILLWLLAYALASLAASITLSLVALKIGFGYDNFGGSSPTAWRYLQSVALFWGLTMVFVAPFAVILSAIPEALGTQPSKWKYAFHGVMSVFFAIGLVSLFAFSPSIFLMGMFLTPAGAVGGFVMGALRQGPLRSMRERASN